SQRRCTHTAALLFRLERRTAAVERGAGVLADLQELERPAAAVHAGVDPAATDRARLLLHAAADRLGRQADPAPVLVGQATGDLGTVRVILAGARAQSGVPVHPGADRSLLLAEVPRCTTGYTVHGRPAQV